MHGQANIYRSNISAVVTKPFSHSLASHSIPSEVSRLMHSPSRSLWSSLSWIIMLMSAPLAGAATSVSLQADQDSLVATGVSNASVANNYGDAGATSVAGSATTHAEQRTITRFNTASAKTSFDTAFGVGRWRIDSVKLQLNCVVPGGANGVFNNPNVAGSFRIDWIPTDTWTEGTGRPNDVTTDGVSWNDIATLATGAVSQGSQSFSGSTGLTNYTLTATTELLNDIIAGDKTSFILSPVSSTMSMVVHSRTFTNSSTRPQLTITASALPAVTTAATNIRGTKATLNGIANANGSPFNVFFDYGETDSYGSSIAATPSSVSGSANTSVTATLSGLAPSTTYHFRVRVTNGTISHLGEDLTFSTLSTPEIAVEQPAATDLTDGVSSIAFGSVAVGQNASRTFTVRNFGGSSLTISGITIDNATAGAGFTASNPAQSTLAVDESTTFTVQFAPTTSGAKTAQLHIASNDADEASFDLTLTGSVLNNTPTISDIANLNINPSTTTSAIPFTIGDVETAASSLLVTGTSNNQTLVPNASIVLGGSGTNRTVTITPAAGKTGVATITISVSDGTASVSDTFVLDVNPDTTAPTLKLTAPAVNASVNEGALVSLQGSATDNKELTKLQVQFNGNALSDVPLSGTSATFSVPLTPVPGVNMIIVQAFDARGNASTITTRSFTYVVNRALQVNVIGNGTVSAPAAGPYPQQVTLQVAKSYKLTATPKTGQVFNGWTVTNAANTGITAAAQELPDLTFTMQPGLTLTANFIANPFTAVAGAYSGLVHASSTDPSPNGSKPSVSTEGLYSANLTNTGSFTGTLLIDGFSLSVNGLFDNTGTARFGSTRATSLSVARVGKPSLLVALHLDLGGADRITGTVTKNMRNTITAVSAITADRAAFNGTTSVVPNDYLTVNGSTLSDGKFTVILPPKGLASQPAGFTIRDYPQGHGYGSLTISKAGKVTATLTLADNTTFTVSSVLSKTKDCPLFAQLYSKLGFFSAQLVLNKDDPNSHASAIDALWSRPYIDGQWYPFGWPEVIKTDLFAARYAATTGASVLPALLSTAATTIANADLNFTEGGLSSPVPKTVNVSTADVVTNVPKADASFSLTITRSTGAISGSFTNGSTKPTFKGTVYQKGTHAGAHGFFLTAKPTVVDGTGESGDVQLLAKPPVL